jgi:hypothetical protein
MFNDVDHPNVALSDWRAFTERQKICKPLSLIDEVIDRSQLSLPDNVFPLARGGGRNCERLIAEQSRLSFWHTSVALLASFTAWCFRASPGHTVYSGNCYKKNW